jgi:outer membrane autotransporter protein
MGVIDSFDGAGISLWARLWQDRGGFSPRHEAANFGNGGRFNWVQRNFGVEAGIDYRIGGQVSLGLLLGQAKADTRPSELRHGGSQLEADSWGLYGTWISPAGFYLDASYRWLDFEVDLDTTIGARALGGDAHSLNLEAGYGWTLSGGAKVEPQLQYTRTRVAAVDAVETGTGMAFRSEGGDSSRARLGVSVRKSFGDANAGWRWTPHATLSVVREFDGGNRYAVNDQFFGETAMEGSSALVELGLAARRSDWSFSGGLNWQDGGAIENFAGGQFNLRYDFR